MIGRSVRGIFRLHCAEEAAQVVDDELRLRFVCEVPPRGISVHCTSRVCERAAKRRTERKSSGNTATAVGVRLGSSR